MVCNSKNIDFNEHDFVVPINHKKYSMFNNFFFLQILHKK